MENICAECRKSADCKRKPRADQWTVAGCSWFEVDTVITNADHIRGMTDEELAEWVWGAESSGRAYGARGKNAWLKWLKAPVEGAQMDGGET